MSVHVGELHTDVVPIVAGEAAGHDGQQAAHSAPLGSDEERWQASRDHYLWLRRRVAAEGFDD